MTRLLSLSSKAGMRDGDGTSVIFPPGEEIATLVRSDITTAWTWARRSSRKSPSSSAIHSLGSVNSYKEAEMVMRLRVEYAYDPESRNWSFRVPSLGIVGGAETREEAEKRVVDAVAFTLEGEQDGTATDQTEVRYLNIEIAAV